MLALLIAFQAESLLGERILGQAEGNWAEQCGAEPLFPLLPPRCYNMLRAKVTSVISKVTQCGRRKGKSEQTKM